MRRSNPTVFLGLFLLATLAAAAGAPSAQLAHLNTTVSQLGLLANAGYNSQSFAQLSALLANLFGSMMTLSEPYFNSFISQALAQNAAILARIIELESLNNAASSVIFNLLNSVSSILGSNVATIGGSLFLFQNTANARLYGLQNSFNSNKTVVDQVAALLPGIHNTIASTYEIFNDATALFNQLEAAVNNAFETLPVIINLPNPANLTSTADPKCATYTVDLTNWYLGPVITHSAVTYPLLSGSQTSAGPFFDTNIISADSSNTVVEICTRNNSPIASLTEPLILQLVFY
jgi:hypothetical protein